MEKIYMEDNNNKQTRRGLVDFSVILSFTVAVFAIFSITMFGIVSFQGTNVSYAAPLDDDSQFTFQYGVHGAGDEEVTLKGQNPADTNSYFMVPIYLAGSPNNYNNVVFCVEHNVEPPDGGTIVRKSEAITDNGLLYLLTNSYANGRPRTNITDDTNKKYIEAYITQVAIWVYMYEVYSNVQRDQVFGIYKSDGTKYPRDSQDPNTPLKNDDVPVNLITAAEMTAIQSATTIINLADQDAITSTIYSGDNLYTKYIRPLVDEAKSASAQKQFYVTYNENDNATLSEDGKYYDSPILTAVGNPSNDLVSFDITVSGVEGAFLVDENKNTLNPTGIPAGKRFYVRIPVEKAPGEGKKLLVNVDGVGHFNGAVGYYYLAEVNGYASQKIITITGVTKNVPGSVQVPLTGGGDTAMNAAQTVYFIGLIILLCGVGIVYANAKPVEVKQQ